MDVNIILDRMHEPSMEDITSYIEDNTRKMWMEMTEFLQTNYKAKPQIVYSTCSAKPGWNVKYKKSGKALCTLYPEKDLFIALVVLSQNDRDVFDLTRDTYCNELTELYDRCTLFNGTKWLMISVFNENVLNDVKKLIMLKVNK